MVYNRIIIGDVKELLPSLGKYDLAILSDIIEHFPKDEGDKLLRNLFDHVEDIVISTNYGFSPKPARGKNIFEEHKSGWMPEDFNKFLILDKAVIDRIRKDERLLVVYLRKL